MTKGKGLKLNTDEVDKAGSDVHGLSSMLGQHSSTSTSAHHKVRASASSGKSSSIAKFFTGFADKTEKVFDGVFKQAGRWTDKAGGLLKSGSSRHKENESNVKTSINKIQSPGDNGHDRPRTTNPQGSSSAGGHTEPSSAKPVPSVTPPHKETTDTPHGGSTTEPSSVPEVHGPKTESTEPSGHDQTTEPEPKPDKGKGKATDTEPSATPTPTPTPKPTPKQGKGKGNKGKGKATEPPPAPTPHHIATDADGNQRLSNAHQATMDPNKFTGYALNPDHPVGGHKAKVFASATGFTKDNAQDLIDQIQHGVTQHEPKLGKVDQWGERYTVEIPVHGPTGSGSVTTGWIYKPGSDSPTLTTLMMGKKK